MLEPRRFVVACLVALSLAGGLPLAGCTGGSPRLSAEDAAKDTEFLTWYADLTEAMKADPQFRQLPIDSDAENEVFSARLHQAYRKKVSVAEFTRWLDYNYPGHTYEISFITSRLPR
jgi:hypothetical protein